MQSDKLILISLSREELAEIISQTIKKEFIRQKKESQEKELLNFKEACELLGVSRSGLNKWKSEGKVPFVKLGKRVFFKRNDLLNALKNSPYYKSIYEIERV